jgi:hypothetical protein
MFSASLRQGMTTETSIATVALASREPAMSGGMCWVEAMAWNSREVAR